MPDRVKPSFAIFDIRALCRAGLSVRVPGCQKLHLTRSGTECFIAVNRLYPSIWQQWASKGFKESHMYVARQVRATLTRWSVCSSDAVWTTSKLCLDAVAARYGVLLLTAGQVRSSGCRDVIRTAAVRRLAAVVRLRRRFG